MGHRGPVLRPTYIRPGRDETKIPFIHLAKHSQGIIIKHIWHACGRREMCTDYLWGNLNKCYIQEDTVVDESITLKGPLKELG